MQIHLTGANEMLNNDKIHKKYVKISINEVL